MRTTDPEQGSPMRTTTKIKSITGAAVALVALTMNRPRFCAGVMRVAALC